MIAEANDLKSVLGYDVPLNISENIPLFTQKKKLNEELEQFRIAIQKRRDEIDDLRKKELSICSGEIT